MQEEERLRKKQEEEERQAKEQAEELAKERKEMMAAYEKHGEKLEEEAAQEAALDAALDSWRVDNKKAEREREAAKAAREEGRKAAAEEAEQARQALVSQLESTQNEAKEAKAALESAATAAPEEIKALQDKLEKMEAEAEEARVKFEEQQEQEKERREKEAAAEAEAERIANEQRALEEAKRPKKWDVTRMDIKLKKKKRMVKYLLQKTDAADVHESIKIENTKARQLSYATPDVYFRGLAKVVGRAGTDAGNDAELMRLMAIEHVRAPSRQTLSELVRSPSLRLTAFRLLPCLS